MDNKRGQGLSTNAIILIILGVAILVILIIGFTIGWGTLVPFLRTDNVDTVVKSCETSCSTQSTFSYCSKVNELKSEGEEVDATCYLLEKVSKFSKYGLQPCSLDCRGVSACADISYTINNQQTKASLKAACDTATELDISNLATDVNTQDTDNTANDACCIAK